jgi:hypothetical protein
MRIGFRTVNLKEQRPDARTTRPILRELPRAYFEQQVRARCEPLASRLFPTIRSAWDAGIRAVEP